MNNKNTILASQKKFAEEVAKIDQKSLLSNMKQREKSAAPSSLIKPAQYLEWCEARKKAIKECEDKMIKTGEYTKYIVSDDNTITA